MEKNGTKEEEKYKSPSGKPIHFFTDSLVELFTKEIYHLDDFADILNTSEDESLSGTGRVFKDLLKRAHPEMQRKADIVEEHFGEISIDFAMYHQIGVDPEKFLGVNFTPKNQGQD